MRPNLRLLFVLALLRRFMPPSPPDDTPLLARWRALPHDPFGAGLLITPGPRVFRVSLDALGRLAVLAAEEHRGEPAPVWPGAFWRAEAVERRPTHLELLHAARDAEERPTPD